MQPISATPLSRGPVLVSAILLVSSAACGPSVREREPATTTPPPSSAVARTLDLTNLAEGAAPHIPWSRNALLNGETDGKVFPAATDEFARTKQLLVMRDRDGNVFAYAPKGPKGTTPIGKAAGRLAVNARRNLVAWIAPDGSPTVLQEGEARPAVLEKQPGVTSGDAVAVLGHDCFNGPETVEGAGCSVYFRSTGTDTPRSYVSSNHGFVEPLSSGTRLFNLQDADARSEVGWTTLKDDQTTCSTYTPRETGSAGKKWRTCDHMPLTFSPDGKHILATGAHGYEGLGASELTILRRADGKPVLSVKNDEKTQAAIVDMAWEDRTHVLAVVVQKLDWAIVRVGLDGSMEFAGKPVRPGAELDDIPFKLSVQP